MSSDDIMASGSSQGDDVRFGGGWGCSGRRGLAGAVGPRAHCAGSRGLNFLLHGNSRPSPHTHSAAGPRSRPWTSSCGTLHGGAGERRERGWGERCRRGGGTAPRFASQRGARAPRGCTPRQRLDCRRLPPALPAHAAVLSAEHAARLGSVGSGRRRGGGKRLARGGGDSISVARWALRRSRKTHFPPSSSLSPHTQPGQRPRRRRRRPRRRRRRLRRRVHEGGQGGECGFLEGWMDFRRGAESGESNKKTHPPFFPPSVRLPPGHVPVARPHHHQDPKSQAGGVGRRGRR